jgi:hypothetical protein
MPRVTGAVSGVWGFPSEFENRTVADTGLVCRCAAVVRAAAAPVGVKVARKPAPLALDRRYPGCFPLIRSMLSTTRTARV